MAGLANSDLAGQEVTEMQTGAKEEMSGWGEGLQPRNRLVLAIGLW